MAAKKKGEALPEMTDLEAWWQSVTMKDYDDMAPKIEEYGGTGEGSADLRIIGDNLAELMGWHDAPDAVLQELGCFFYLQGKIARLISDYKQKKPGKADTLHDITVYSMMIRRLQDAGRWP